MTSVLFFICYMSTKSLSKEVGKKTHLPSSCFFCLSAFLCLGFLSLLHHHFYMAAPPWGITSVFPAGKGLKSEGVKGFLLVRFCFSLWKKAFLGTYAYLSLGYMVNPVVGVQLCSLYTREILDVGFSGINLYYLYLSKRNLRTMWIWVFVM